MLPISPIVIPEEKSQLFLSKKSTAVQTTIEIDSSNVNSTKNNEGNKNDVMNANATNSCRCPNCNCSNCGQAEDDLENDDDDDPLRVGYSNSDEDSGTESLKEELSRKLSVSSFAKSSASVLLHSCFVSDHEK